MPQIVDIKEYWKWDAPEPQPRSLGRLLMIGTRSRGEPKTKEIRYLVKAASVVYLRFKDFDHMDPRKPVLHVIGVNYDGSSCDPAAEQEIGHWFIQTEYITTAVIQRPREFQRARRSTAAYGFRPEGGLPPEDAVSLESLEATIERCCQQRGWLSRLFGR